MEEYKKAKEELNAAYKKIEKYVSIVPLEERKTLEATPLEEMKQDFNAFHEAEKKYLAIAEKAWEVLRTGKIKIIP